MGSRILLRCVWSGGEPLLFHVILMSNGWYIIKTMNEILINGVKSCGVSKIHI